jgi:hypothetical protein
MSFGRNTSLELLAQTGLAGFPGPSLTSSTQTSISPPFSHHLHGLFSRSAPKVNDKRGSIRKLDLRFP